MPEAIDGGCSSDFYAAPAAEPTYVEDVDEDKVDEAREADVKETKKLQKALRDIESLESRQAAGEGLQANQIKKIGRRDEYEKKLRELEDNIRNRDEEQLLAAAVAPALAEVDPVVEVPEPRRCPAAADPPRRLPAPLCKHFLAGRCSFGNACWMSHDVAKSSASQNADFNGCKVRPSEPAFDTDDPECGICFESIRRKGERFGILVNCDHAFCLSCIRSWRLQKEQQERKNLRLCPVCRKESFFVIPSDDVILDPEEKRRAMDIYKAETARIPCKMFDYGRGKCNFGTSCWYAHLNPDGTRYVPPPLHWRNGADGSEVQPEVKLSDFLAHSLAL